MRVKSLIFGLAAAAALAACGGTKVIKNGDTLVFMGDSITKFGNDHAYGYLHLVANGLAANGINVTWYGAGISGDTAAQMRSRFQSAVLSKNPNVVTIFGGVNDCGGGWTKAGGGSSTPDEIAAMADMAIEAGATPVLLSPTGVNGESFKQNVCDYAAAVKQIAQARSIPYAATYEAYRAYLDDPTTPALGGYGYKASADGTHMSLIGDRILAREVLKAFGLDSTELAKAEAEWNSMTALVSMHPSVKITAAEQKAVKVAAARAGRPLNDYQIDLFRRGVQLLQQSPAKVSATSGAGVQLSATVPSGYVEYDQLIACGRMLSTHDSVESIVNYALLAAVHELPSVTDADLPTEPVKTVDATAFAKSITFTCSGYAGKSTLADFPVAVRLAAGSPAGFRYADMANSASGGELRFADSTGRSLAYEVEEWNPSGTSLVWVKLPKLAKSTSFTMYYGGTPTDTVDASWTWRAAEYVGVWHMTENGGTAFDSANGLHAGPVGAYASSMQKTTTGVFGKGRVNSSDTRGYQGQSMLQVDDSTLLDCGSTFTFSGWVKMTDLPAYDLGRIASRNRGGQYAPDWELRLPGYTTLNGYAGSNTPISGTLASVQNTWAHIVGVFNGTTLTTYANGVQVFSSAITAVQDSDNKLVFGAFDLATPNGHFVGHFDEFRLRDAVSSADWVKAEYDQAGGTFLTVGGTPVVDPPGGDEPEDPPSEDEPEDPPGGDEPDNPPVVDPADALTPSGDATGASDCAAIQSAIGAAGASGTVTLGSGTFYLNAQLTLADGKTLKGQGWKKTILKQVAKDCRVVSLDGGAKLEGVTVTGSRISVKWTHGGGVEVNDGTVSWCCVSNNVLSSNNSYGGGIHIGKGTVDHCVVAFNQAGTATSGGGGIALYNTPWAVDIDTCLVYGNTTSVSDAKGNGGGIAIVMNTPTVTIRNTTVTGNSSTGKAGGISFDTYNASRLKLVNSIVSGNSAGESANVYGTANSGWTGNVIDGDPKFANAAVNDYRIASNSPAKGAGTAYSGIGKDLAGVDFANPPSAGCYEYDGSTPGGGEGGGDEPDDPTGGDEPDDPQGGDEPDDPPVVDPTETISASGDATGATDTAKIQTALNAAAANGGTVTLGSGTFCINAQLVLDGGVTLVGQGWKKTILKQVVSGEENRVATVKGGSTVKNVTLTGGRVNVSGNYKFAGGVLLTDGMISWCCISNNVISAGNVVCGGGVGIYAGKGRIDHSIIADNTVSASSEVNVYGGGIGICQATGDVTVDSCLIAGNTSVMTKGHRSGAGGGIGVNGTYKTVTVRNTTIVGNAAGKSDGDNSYASDGGAVHCDGGTFKLTNCILADNATAQSGKNLHFHNTTVAIDHCLYDSSDYSNDASARATITGCASGDPKFASGYTLSSDSPAKGTGTTYSDTGKDLAGCDFANPPSMGCYEFGGTPPPDDPQDDPQGGDDPEPEEPVATIEDETWIRETAAAFGSTGTWTGDRAVVESGKISVSNATFTAARPAPRTSVVTLATTFDFGKPWGKPLDTTKCAGIAVVRAGGVNRYAVLTASGVVTNLAVVANVGSPAVVMVTLDDAAHTVAYSVDGAALGTYPMAAKAKGVSTIRYAGVMDVSALNGAYHVERQGTNLAKVGDAEYATVEAAIAAAGGRTVTLLWNASWTPTSAGDYMIDKNGFDLEIGGGLARTLKDNGDGTVTVTVGGGEPTPAKRSKVIFYID